MMFDCRTTKWFSHNIAKQTTVCKCEKCGLYYKPCLGHKCKEDKE